MFIVSFSLFSDRFGENCLPSDDGTYNYTKMASEMKTTSLEGASGMEIAGGSRWWFDGEQMNRRFLEASLCHIKIDTWKLRWEEKLTGSRILIISPPEAYWAGSCTYNVSFQQASRVWVFCQNGPLGFHVVPSRSLAAKASEKLQRAPIASRIVFLCHHFSAVNSLLNFRWVML